MIFPEKFNLIEKEFDILYAERFHKCSDCNSGIL